MTDHHDTEDAVRRARAGVAAPTPTEPPPPRGEVVVPLVDHRQRRILAAVAAAVAVVAGITGAVLLTGGDEEPESVETADDTSTTTEPVTSTSSSTSSTAVPSTTATTVTAPTSTTVAATPDRGALLAAGDGWEVRRTEGGDSCVVIVVAGGDPLQRCDLVAGQEAPGPALTTVLPNGVPLAVVPVGAADTVEVFAGSGIFEGASPLVDDPFLDRLRFLVTDRIGAAQVLRRGDAIIGVVYDDGIVIEELAPYGSYRRASGSLSMGEFIEIGAYGTPEAPCVVAFRLTPFFEVAADECRRAPFAVLTPTSEPMLLDPFGLAPLSDVTQWSCTLPSGSSCGTDFVTPVPALGVTVLSWHGPISVDDGGTRADRVTFTVDDRSFDVAVPPAA